MFQEERSSGENSRDDGNYISSRDSSSPQTDLVHPSWPVRYIKNWKEYSRFAGRLEKLKEFSIDTETWGPPGERLDKHLCLIQVGIPKMQQGRPVHGQGESILIDVVALTQEARSQSAEDDVRINPLAPLKQVLEDENITKVVQHARFETNQFDKYGINLAGVADTETLGRQLRPELVSHSLAALSLEVLGKRISKEEQTSDWHIRPLAEEQISYAALDAEITMEVYFALKDIQKAAEINEQQSVEALLEQIIDNASERATLLRGRRGNLYGQLGVYLDRLQAAAEARVWSLSHDGRSFRFEGSNGTASLESNKITEPDLEKLRKLFPDIAEELIFETATRDRIEESLRVCGWRSSEIEEIIETLYDEIDKTPTLTLRPAFDRLDAPGKNSPPPYSESWGIKIVETDAAFRKLLEKAKEKARVYLSVHKVPREGKKIGKDTVLTLSVPGARTAHLVNLNHIASESIREEREPRSIELLQALLTCDDMEKVLFGCRELKAYAKSQEIELQGLTDLKPLAEAHRADLPHHSLDTCVREMLESSLPVEKDPTDVTLENPESKSAQTAAIRLESTVQLAQLLKKMDEESQIDPDLTLDQIFGEMVETASLRQTLIRNGIGNDIATYNERFQRMVNAIGSQLEKRAGQEKKIVEQGEGGRATLSLRAKRALSIQRLRDEHPDIADEIIYEHVFKKDLEIALRSRGFERRYIDDALEQLYNITGYAEPAARTWPKYKKIYITE